MNAADLAELKRLRAMLSGEDKPFALTTYLVALMTYADALIAAAEECERLRQAVRFAAGAYDDHLSAGSLADRLYEVSATARAALEEAP